jgi:hypothetical protein
LAFRDALKLPFAPQVGLGEHAEHVEEAFARRGAGVDRLLGGVNPGKTLSSGLCELRTMRKRGAKPASPSTSIPPLVGSGPSRFMRSNVITLQRCSAAAAPAPAASGADRGAALTFSGLLKPRMF